MRNSLAERLRIPSTPPLSKSAQLRRLLLLAVGQLTGTNQPSMLPNDRALLQQFLAAALVDDPTTDWYLRQLAIVNRGKRLPVLPSPTIELIDSILTNGLEDMPATVFLQVAADPVVIITCAEQMKSDFPQPWRALIDLALEDLLTQTSMPVVPAVGAPLPERPLPGPLQSPHRGAGNPRPPIFMSLSLAAQDADENDEVLSGQDESETPGETPADDEKPRG